MVKKLSRYEVKCPGSNALLLFECFFYFFDVICPNGAKHSSWFRPSMGSDGKSGLQRKCVRLSSDLKKCQFKWFCLQNYFYLRKRTMLKLQNSAIGSKFGFHLIARFFRKLKKWGPKNQNFDEKMKFPNSSRIISMMF